MQLVASVNGVVKLTATDSSQVAITAPGTAGMWTELAGIWFGHFVVSGAATGGDGGIPDAGTADAGTPDAGIPDAGTPDAGTPDAGTPDVGPPAGGGILFSDNFNRTLAAGLGPAWHIDSGAWRDNDKANSDQRAPDQASVIGLSCADCKVEAKVVNFAATIAALDLRQTAAGDRYDVALLANGRLQIRRHNGGTVTVLADVLSGIADLGNWSTIALSATGAGPVALSAFVNGAARVSATDTSSAAITAPGTAGMWTDLSGVLFDDFIVTGVESAGGGADAGVDAGTPDAGISDAGAPDAGTSDAGASDAGTADAGSPGGILFTDDFNRTLCCDLGPRWNILSGGWRDNSKANSDRTALDRAAAAGVSCADCRIDASMVNFTAAKQCSNCASPTRTATPWRYGPTESSKSGGTAPVSQPCSPARWEAFPTSPTGRASRSPCRGPRRSRSPARSTAP